MIAGVSISKCLLYTTCLGLALACIQPSIANPSFGVWVVDTSHATHDPIIVDVDGDGLKDLVLPKYFSETGRELHIYMQEANEKFSNSPLKIEIKSEAIGFAMADVRETPGTEIIWITADAFYSFSASVQGYVGNLEHVADWELFVRHPDSKELLYVEAIDMNNDGLRDLVLPGPLKYGLFLNNPDEGLDFVGSIQLPKSLVESELDTNSRVFGAREVNTISLTEIDDGGEMSWKHILASRSQYEGLFSQIDRNDRRTRSISYGSWQSGAIARDVNGDELVDLVVRSLEGFRFGLLTSHTTSSPTSVHISAESDANTQNGLNLVSYVIPYGGFPVVSSLEDVDGDGDLDIVSINSGITSSKLYLLENEGGRFSFLPTQVLRINGTVIAVEFESIHRGAAPFLLINTVTTPLRKILTEIELHRNLLVFGSDRTEQGLFKKRPSLTSTQSINIDSFRNLMPSTLQFDLDSDGSNDILECKSDGTVQALRIDETPRLDSEPFWQFTPEFAVFTTRSDDLNNDQLPDLILNHTSAVTLLISRP